MSAKFEDFLQEQLQDTEFRKEYEALQPERAVIQAMIDARKIPDLPKRSFPNAPALRRVTSVNLKTEMPILPSAHCSVLQTAWG